MVAVFDALCSAQQVDVSRLCADGDGDGLGKGADRWARNSAHEHESIIHHY